MLDTQSNASISMTALYRRLGGVGLTRSTVRNTLLPDWWCIESDLDSGKLERLISSVEDDISVNRVKPLDEVLNNS